MRAEEPKLAGRIDRDGVGIAYEVYGEGPLTLVLLPCWIIVHARSWKAQIADLAQDCRLVVVEGRGNGASGRPAGPAAYDHEAYLADALAVMDHLGVADCALFGFSRSGPLAALVARERPQQVKAAVLIAPTGPMSATGRKAREESFLTTLETYEGWAKYSAGYMRQDYRGFLEFFFARMFPEPHSTKQTEDAIAWGLETTPQVLIDSTLGALRSEADLAGAYASLACPTLVIHGDADEIVPVDTGRRVAELAGAEFVVRPGNGHGPHLRHPTEVNRLIRAFLVRCGLLPERRAGRRRQGRPRALYLSSPIGLGHVRRDLAIANALRERRPELSIDWLAQDPVTRFLSTADETVHPASTRLASETGHIEAEAGEHDLNVFQALRRMDEILVRNFRVFQQAVEEGGYDLVIADEGWEIDHFWHEHPSFKRAPLVWMTDFVGFAPMPEGGAAEARLTADYNAEMIGHVEGHPGVRDRAIFVGALEDVVDDALGPDLPRRRDWTAQRYAFSGYVLGEGLPGPADRAALRAAFGFADGEEVCLVTVGGSGVGSGLIRRAVDAISQVRRMRPGFRAIVVTGPRLRPDGFPATAGVEYRAFEPRLPELMAACDLALVQGGLSTCMELAAVGTPFVYVPLQRHFEQNVHVAHRLANYGAGRRLDFAHTDPDRLAATMLQAMAAPAAARPVERDGAARAAGLIAELF